MQKIEVMLLGVLVCLLTACSQNSASKIPYTEVPTTGDAVRGAELFDAVVNNAPQCTSCHNETANAAPMLDGFGAVAGTRVEGQDAREYAFYSITEPGRFVVEGFGNAMYNQYDEKMTPQQIADLIAYLLSL